MVVLEVILTKPYKLGHRVHLRDDFSDSTDVCIFVQQSAQIMYYPHMVQTVNSDMNRYATYVTVWKGARPMNFNLQYLGCSLLQL